MPRAADPARRAERLRPPVRRHQRERRARQRPADRRLLALRRADGAQVARAELPQPARLSLVERTRRAHAPALRRARRPGCVPRHRLSPARRPPRIHLAARRRLVARPALQHGQLGRAGRRGGQRRARVAGHRTVVRAARPQRAGRSLRGAARPRVAGARRHAALLHQPPADPRPAAVLQLRGLGARLPDRLRRRVRLARAGRPALHADADGNVERLRPGERPATRSAEERASHAAPGAARPRRGHAARGVHRARRAHARRRRAGRLRRRPHLRAPEHAGRADHPGVQPASRVRAGGARDLQVRRGHHGSGWPAGCLSRPERLALAGRERLRGCTGRPAERIADRGVPSQRGRRATPALSPRRRDRRLRHRHRRDEGRSIRAAARRARGVAGRAARRDGDVVGELPGPGPAPRHRRRHDHRVRETQPHRGPDGDRRCERGDRRQRRDAESYGADWPRDGPSSTTPSVSPASPTW